MIVISLISKVASTLAVDIKCKAKEYILLTSLELSGFNSALAQTFDVVSKVKLP